MSDQKNQFHFISQLSAMPAEGLARIPILVTGSWIKGGRKLSLTREELRTAIANFQKLANHDLNVDYDHACEDLGRAAGEPTPSAGRISALDPPEPFGAQSADCQAAGSPERWILYGRYEPTSRARQLIKSREYRYVSAAFAKEYSDRRTGEPQGLTLTSVALTNQPFLDELPEIWLSVSVDPVVGRLREEQNRSSHHPIAGSPDYLSRLSAEQGGNMANLTLKCSADGTHEAYDGERKVGEIDNGHLFEYAANHVGKEGAIIQDNLSVHGAGVQPRTTLRQEFYSTFAREVGAEGRSQEEIRGLVTLALHPPKAEVTLLSESIGADGRLDNSRLDALDDSGAISRSAWRRAKDAEQRVQNAFHRGQITPAMMATGAPLRLALSDGAAFKALIEDRPALAKLNSVIGIGGSGSETGESPRQLFSRLVEEKKQQLMQVDVRLGELDAHRKAGALVAKENPDLLKNYRADAKSA
jgi:phage I-like protein